MQNCMTNERQQRDMSWIQDTYRSTVGWDILEQLVDIGNRMAGSDGEYRGARVVRNTFEELGLTNPRFEPFEITGWKRNGSKLLVDDRPYDCIALPRGPDSQAAGTLVNVGYGLPNDFEQADLEGKIALVRTDVPGHYHRYIHRREKYFQAIEAGAAGFIYQNHVPGQLPPTGSIADTDADIGPIPAVGVSKEVGDRLARRHEGDEVAMNVDAQISADAISRNVHAELGPDTDKRVLVTSHVDAHDIAEGAADNGAGTAAVIEIARALKRREENLDYRVEFITFGAEEVGLVGSSVDAASRAESVRAVLNSDSIVAARDLKFFTHGHDDIQRAVEDALDELGHQATVTPELAPHSDHWPYVSRGVPGIMAIADDDDTGRGWGHTEADTLDKLDRRNLQEQSLLLTEIATRLADDQYDFPRRDTAALAAEAEAQDLAEGMRVTGDWPFEH